MDTVIRISEQEAHVLEQLARRRGKTVEQLIQEAIQMLLASQMAETSPDTRLREQALALAGQFHGGPSDLSEEHDRYLADAFSSLE